MKREVVGHGSASRVARFWGAQSFRVLVIAFCDHALSRALTIDFGPEPDRKFVAAEYGDQHAASVRSPEILRPKPPFNFVTKYSVDKISTTSLFWTRGSAPARDLRL
jgi:hypothetical protein